MLTLRRWGQLAVDIGLIYYCVYYWAQSDHLITPLVIGAMWGVVDIVWTIPTDYIRRDRARERGF